MLDNLFKLNTRANIVNDVLTLMCPIYKFIHFKHLAFFLYIHCNYKLLERLTVETLQRLQFLIIYNYILASWMYRLLGNRNFFSRNKLLESNKTFLLFLQRNHRIYLVSQQSKPLWLNYYQKIQRLRETTEWTRSSVLHDMTRNITRHNMQSNSYCEMTCL